MPRQDTGAFEVAICRPYTRYALSVTSNALVRTFLIADIRGYTRFTEEHGDAASARLTGRFSELVRDGVEIRGGQLIEIRGDEALAVFDSARQAIRAGMDLQRWFAEHTEADPDLPLRVGIGIDSGEAALLDDGSFRGAALNVAARLCALARGGEVIVSEGTSRVAGRIPGVRYIDRGRAHLKGIAGTVNLIRAAPEEEPQEQGQTSILFFGGQRRLGWPIAIAVVLIAAATAAAVVYLTTGNSTDTSSGAAGTTTSTTTATGTGTSGEPVAPRSDVLALIPSSLRKTCVRQTVADAGAVATAICLPPASGGGFYPDRWQVSIYPSGKAVRAAYEEQLQREPSIKRNTGKCTSLSWGGEGAWQHGPGKPGGRRFCYFDGNNAVIVWIHERLGQSTHRDVLGIAQEGGLDHVRLIGWWAFAHHLIGKVT
jgi:class 3 adenylate cyclase